MLNILNKLTTSKAISIKFTAYVIFIIILFCIFINTLFFQQRYTIESNKFRDIIRSKNTWWNNFVQAPKPSRTFTSFAPGVIVVWSENIAEQLEANKLLLDISRLDEEYVIYRTDNQDKTSFVIVTRFVQSQIYILWMSILLVFFFSVFTYLLSRYFIK